MRLSSLGTILLALIAGMLLGYLNIHFFTQLADIFAQLFSKLLRLIAAPLLFFSVLSSFLSMKGVQEFRLIGRKLFFYTLLTTLLAASFASILYSWFFSSPPTTEVFVRESQSSGFFSHLFDSIPENFFTPFIEGNVFAIALLALGLGFSSLFLNEATRKTLQTGCSALLHWLICFTKGILLLLPIAMWAFSYLLINKWGEVEIPSTLFLYIGTIFAANLFQGTVVLPLLLKWKKRSPWSTFTYSLPALATAFFTKSSNATLPLSLECAQKKLGIREKTANFSLPLCSVINMNGCAAFILITLFYVTGVYGITFTFWEKIIWVVIASFAAIGNAGVPMGCYFLSSALILSYGLPTEIMGLILPFYLILDMFETSLNVWSDICITCAVEKDLTKDRKQEAPA